MEFPIFADMSNYTPTIINLGYRYESLTKSTNPHIISASAICNSDHQYEDKSTNPHINKCDLQLRLLTLTVTVYTICNTGLQMQTLTITAYTMCNAL
jgi:hypothetical protein